MKFLVDTDWVIDLLLDRPSTVRLRSILDQDRFAISEVTFGEVYDGILHGQDAIAADIAFAKFLTAVDLLPLTTDIWKRFAYLRGFLRRRGELIPDFDILIAATAVQHDLILVTRNRKHFQRIPDLKLALEQEETFT